MSIKKGRVTARLKAKAPVFESNRLHGTEVKTAVMAAKTLRSSLGYLLRYVCYAKIKQRLSRELMRVIRADVINPIGYRNADDGAIELLEGFEFNERCKMSDIFLAPFTCSIDHVEGRLSVTIPPFISENSILTTGYFTHFKLVCVGIKYDFSEEDFVRTLLHTPALSLDGSVTKPIEFVYKNTDNRFKSIFLALGIQLYQLTLDSRYELHDHVLKALVIVKVSGRPRIG